MPQRATGEISTHAKKKNAHHDTVSTHRCHGDVKRETGNQYGRLECFSPPCDNGCRIRFQFSPGVPTPRYRPGVPLLSTPLKVARVSGQ